MMRDDSARKTAKAGSRTLLLTVTLVVLAGCNAGDDDLPAEGDVRANGQLPEAVATDLDVQGDDREFVTVDDFVRGYWLRPVPPQGEASDAWSPLEASLLPEDCGTCHPVQYGDWQTAVHSEAYSPGLSGQLVNWEQNAFGTVESCLVCHAPLSEQSARVAAGEEWASNPSFDPALRDHGIVCAACHVRGTRRHGPPRRDGSVDASPEGSPHGGVTRTEFFEDSRFCSGCHQFEPGGAAPNGKLLENTYTEWENSRYAAEGVVCQTCHMPDRRHLWRGIHDPDMVRSGVTIEWTISDAEAGLQVTNTGTGHRFPTYATPEVLVSVQLLDADRQPIVGAYTEHAIARRIGYQAGAWVELSDTRLLPDSGVAVTVAVPPEARHVRASITVRPDAFYRELFESLLTGMLSDTSRALLTEAGRRAESSPFRIFDEAVPLQP
jgi:hypothetical protein